MDYFHLPQDFISLVPFHGTVNKILCFSSGSDRKGWRNFVVNYRVLL
jgi:hypothetical protein